MVTTSPITAFRMVHTVLEEEMRRGVEMEDGDEDNDEAGRGGKEEEE